MPSRFDKFVQEENIRNFKSKIATETDLVRLVLLRSLLQEEEALQRHREEAEYRATRPT